MPRGYQFQNYFILFSLCCQYLVPGYFIETLSANLELLFFLIFKKEGKNESGYLLYN